MSQPQQAKYDSRLVDELEGLVGPLAGRLGLSLAFIPLREDRPVWRWGPEVLGEPLETLELSGPLEPLGRMAVWAGQQSPEAGALETVKRLLSLVTNNLRLESREADLKYDFSAGWDGLGRQEEGAESHSLQGTAELLAMIIDRAVAEGPDYRAVMWIETEGRLTPAAWRNVEPPEEIPLTIGLIGRAISSGRDVVLNSPDELELESATAADKELFRGAGGLVVAPVTASVGLTGALSIWHHGEGGRIGVGAVNMARALANQAAMVVENDRLHYQSLENELISQEMAIGSDIQQSLLLGTPPGKLTNMRAAAVSLASRQVAGDFYDFFRHRGYLLDVIVGDVMGKGIAAALLGAATKAQFLRSLTHLTAFAGRIRLPDPAAVVSDLHAEVVPELISLDIFITLCYARIDLGRKLLEFVDCGHTEIIHYRPVSGRCERLKGENMPLGFVADETYRLVTRPLGEGDILFFYSDGVTECTRPDGEMYGVERLVDIIEKNAALSPGKIIDMVTADLIDYSGHDTFDDDVTCVAIKIVGQDNSEPPRDRLELDFVSELEEATAIRMFVRSFCVAHNGRGLSDSALARLLLAVHEAATNVVKHAYQGQPDQTINVVAEEYGDHVNVKIAHRGRDLDLATVPPPEFDGTRDGGFGLYIIEESVDEVRYFDDQEGRHCVSLVMKKDKD